CPDCPDIPIGPSDPLRAMLDIDPTGIVCARSTLANTSALAWRSAGSLAIAVRMALFSESGISGRVSFRSGTGAETCIRKSSFFDAATYGGLPARRKYIVAPRE